MNKTRRSSLLQFSLFDSTALSAPIGTESTLHDQLPVADTQTPVAVPKAPLARNYRLTGDRALAPTWKGRAADNLAAIRLLQEIEAAERPATPDEQERLSRFVGFGASELANTLFRRAGEAFRPGWDEMGSELEAMVSTAEMAGLTRATQYAHYTPEFIVRAMWATLTRMGFAGGSVLEPGCGTGPVHVTAPGGTGHAWIKTSLTGIEADPITARIADRLFPDAWIRSEDFTKARIPETFDLAIGNPPFSDRTVRALGVVSAAARIPVGESVHAGRPKAARIVVGTAAEGATVKEGSYVLLGLDLNQIIDGVPVPVAVKTAGSKEGVFAKHARIVRGLIPIRDAVRCVLRAQEANEPWARHRSGSAPPTRASCGNSARSTTPASRRAPTRKRVR